MIVIHNFTMFVDQREFADQEYDALFSFMVKKYRLISYQCTFFLNCYCFPDMGSSLNLMDEQWTCDRIIVRINSATESDACYRVVFLVLAFFLESQNWTQSIKVKVCYRFYESQRHRRQSTKTIMADYVTDFTDFDRLGCSFIGFSLSPDVLDVSATDLKNLFFS